MGDDSVGGVGCVEWLLHPAKLVFRLCDNRVVLDVALLPER